MWIRTAATFGLVLGAGLLAAAPPAQADQGHFRGGGFHGGGFHGGFDGRGYHRGFGRNVYIYGGYTDYCALGYYEYCYN